MLLELDFKNKRKKAVTPATLLAFPPPPPIVTPALPDKKTKAKNKQEHLTLSI